MLLASRVIAWLFAAAIVVLSLVPAELRPETDLPHDLEHFLIFLATGLAFGTGYGRRPGLLAILLVIFSGLVEIAQLLAPGRHARLGDFVVDALAISTGVIAARLAGRYAAKISSSVR